MNPFLKASAMALLISLPAVALADEDAVDLDAVNLDEVTMSVEDAKERGLKLGKHERMGRKQLILEHMLENGDITQEEIDERIANRAAVKEELKALRESGDQEALTARITELREERAERRQALRDYVEANEDLADALKERREDVLERRRLRREERKNAE